MMRETSFDRYDLEARSVSRSTLHDTRFAAVLGREAWHRLPDETRARFSKRVGPGDTLVYIGVIEHTQISRLGVVLVQALRLIGAPLPLDRTGGGRPALVSVTEDAAGDGQFWTRHYGREGRGFPQTISSTKRFSGPTGCEEWIRSWLGMRLRVSEDRGTLTFESDTFLLRIAGRMLSLPRWMGPGCLRVTHHDLGQGEFRFTLTLAHRLFGTLIDQSIRFRDVDPLRL